MRAAPRPPWHDAEDRLVALFAAAVAEREAALQCICRALLRLEREGHLDLLPRTLDFELVCTEINEDPFDSDMRLQRLRRALS